MNQLEKNQFKKVLAQSKKETITENVFRMLVSQVLFSFFWLMTCILVVGGMSGLPTNFSRPDWTLAFSILAAIWIVPFLALQSLRLQKKPLASVYGRAVAELPRIYRKTDLPDASIQLATDVSANGSDVKIEIILYTKNSFCDFSLEDIFITSDAHCPPNGFYDVFKNNLDRAFSVGINHEYSALRMYEWQGSREQSANMKSKADEWCRKEEIFFNTILENHQKEVEATQEFVEQLKHF